MVRTTRCPTYSTISPHRVGADSAQIGIAAACTRSDMKTRMKSIGKALVDRIASRIEARLSARALWASSPLARYIGRFCFERPCMNSGTNLLWLLTCQKIRIEFYFVDRILVRDG